MKREVVSFVLLLWKVYLCEAENVIINSTKQLVCQFPNGNRWQKFSYVSTFWETIHNNGRYSGAYSSILTITNFQIEDAGNYRCKANSTGSTGASIELSPEVQAHIGSVVTLTCTVLGTPVYWYTIGINGQRTLTDDVNYEGSSTKYLKIKSLTTNTAAVYHCLLRDGPKGPDITVSIAAGWSSWNAWGVCNVACGTGQRQRSRTCSGSCSGSANEIEMCTVDYGVDGSWSTWSSSGPCTRSCGVGSHQRVRLCNSPPQANCGAYCNGEDNDRISCSLSACPVNRQWSSWNSWGACTVTCGTGQQRRIRTCDNPVPANNGAYCQGPGSEYTSCLLSVCSVNGGWSSWNSWGACNVTCGTGQQSRSRICNNPAPQNNGAYCPGKEYAFNSCTQPACPVNGGWSSWTSGACNATSCGTGQKSRSRYCNNPLKANGGADCQGEKDELIACVRSECAEQQSGNTPILVGTVIGILVIVILILILVIYAKRRWHKSKEKPDYEITDMTKAKSHIYGKIHVNQAYQNEQQSAEVEVSNTENQYINEAHLVERYDVSELTKRCQNKEYFLQSLKAEFRLLNNSTDDSKPFNSQYEIVNTGLRQDVNQLHLDSSTLDVLYTDNVSILLEPPQKDIAEQFWTIVDNQCVENIILLAKGNEKMSEFYPMLDDIMRINNFEIYLDSAERMNKHIMLLTFNLQNKTTQSIRQIRMFKTNVSEYPTVQILCFVMDKASEIRGVPVLIINSEMADLSVCGVLTVCLNAMYAIKNGSLFSVLGNATMASKNNSSFFKNFDDYELCYKVLGNYLEAVHTYDFIE